LHLIIGSFNRTQTIDTKCAHDKTAVLFSMQTRDDDVVEKLCGSAIARNIWFE